MSHLRQTLIVLTLLIACPAACAPTLLAFDRFSSSEYPPPSGQGRVVIVLSGTSGPSNYTFVARDLAALGYYAVLHDAKNFPAGEASGGEHLRQVISNAQQSPHAIPGKVAVVGFSLGGGTALAHASAQSDLVAVVVAYYPATGNIPDKSAAVSHWSVPTLALAGEADGNRHCRIDVIREMASAAKDRGAPFELVTYPGADHGFNLGMVHYQKAAADDAWRRTRAALRQHLGT
jgi:dienelactone hydrolase